MPFQVLTSPVFQLMLQRLSNSKSGQRTRAWKEHVMYIVYHLLAQAPQPGCFLALMKHNALQSVCRTLESYPLDLGMAQVCLNALVLFVECSKTPECPPKFKCSELIRSAGIIELLDRHAQQSENDKLQRLARGILREYDDESDKLEQEAIDASFRSALIEQKEKETKEFNWLPSFDKTPGFALKEPSVFTLANHPVPVSAVASPPAEHMDGSSEGEGERKDEKDEFPALRGPVVRPSFALAAKLDGEKLPFSPPFASFDRVPVFGDVASMSALSLPSMSALSLPVFGVGATNHASWSIPQKPRDISEDSGLTLSMSS